MLRRALLFSCLMILSHNVCLSETLEERELRFCKQVESFSSLIMTARQKGMKFSQALEHATNGKRDKEIVFDAYKRNRIANEKIKQLIITEFGNKWFGECMQNPDLFLDGIKHL